MESSENKQRSICPIGSVLPSYGFVHADDEWLLSFHINTSTVVYQPSTQERNAKII